MNGIEINYRLEGDGPETIVLVNGLGDVLEDWVHQIPDLLNAGFRVLRFDNRGVGLSGAPPGRYTSRMLAHDVRGLTQELGLDSFHLVGMSMGGMIAQEYAIEHGETLRSLILACTYASPGPFCSRVINIWAAMASMSGVSLVMRDLMLRAFTVEFFDERESEVEQLEAELSEPSMSADAFLSQLNVARTHDARDRLKRIDVPTLVLCGEGDTLIPVGLSRRLHDAIAHAAWATTKGGHACLSEYPSEFNRTILSWLAEPRKNGAAGAIAGPWAPT